MRARLLLVIAWFACVALAGCTQAPIDTCLPGLVRACVCPGGASGVQTCLPGGTYGSCGCAVLDAGAKGPDANIDANAKDAPAPLEERVDDVFTMPDEGPQKLDVLAVTDGDFGDANADETAVDASDASDGSDASDVTDASGADTAREPPEFCPPASVVDLGSVGVHAGTVTRYTGDNLTASNRSLFGMPCGQLDHVVVHRYVPRAESRVVVMAQPTEDSPAFEAVVMVMDACLPPAFGGANQYGCARAGGAGVVVPRAVAGAPIYIALGGTAPTRNPSTLRGRYVLTVIEAPLVARGATCDPSSLTNACEPGSSCQNSEAPRCVADGVEGGRCRLPIGVGATECDAGLGCREGFCVTALPAGASCSSAGALCASGHLCYPAPTLICRPIRDPSRPCIPGVAASCGADLTCNASGACVPIVPAESVCDSTQPVDVCVAGTRCAGRRCAPEGAFDGRCRSTLGLPRCDPGLACSSRETICVPGASAGSSCRSAPCADGLICGTDSTCVAEGAPGGNCRRSSTAPRCDPGLLCSGFVDGTCHRPAEGEPACDPAGAACTQGRVCVTTDGVSRCEPRYAESTVAATGYVAACATGHREYLRPFADGAGETLPLPLPFAFRFYGTARSHVIASVRGWARFGEEPLTLDVTDIVQRGFNALDPLEVIAPYYLGSASRTRLTLNANGRVCSATMGAAPSRRFAIEWEDFGVAGVSEVHVSFEVVLHEGTDVIEFFYRRLEPTTGLAVRLGNGLAADIGISGVRAIPTFHYGPVRTSEGLRFTPRSTSIPST